MGSKHCQPLSPGVACAVVRHFRRTDDWKDDRRSRHTDDTDVLLRIHHVIGELPTYGYRRVWELLRRQAELDGMPANNAKRVYRIMRQNAPLLERKTPVSPSKRAHTGRPDGLTAAKNLTEAFEHYNEWHPHSALGYRSPREYLRQRASNGLSDNRCLDI